MEERWKRNVQRRRSEEERGRTVWMEREETDMSAERGEQENIDRHESNGEEMETELLQVQSK